MPASAVDIAELVVGPLFIAIGAAAAATSLSARPKGNRTAAVFAAFCTLYGIRDLANSELIVTTTQWPPDFFQYVDAFVTYTILVPATLFVESLVGPGRHLVLRRTWQVLAVCGASAILFDAVMRQPTAAMPINAPMIGGTVGVWFWHLATRARQRRWSAELRVVVIAGAVVALIAVYETIADRGLLEPFDAEPWSMLVFAATLGWFVLVRTQEQAVGYAALSRELELARQIQLSLVPQRMPEIPGLRLSGAYLPMTAVAGDFYDVLPLDGGRTLVFIADVSGHGMPAALVASMVKVTLAAEADRYDNPGDILTGINRALTGKFEGAYVTACCVVVDAHRDRLTYALAGHPPPILRKASGQLEPLDLGGLVMTVMPGVVYATTEVPFELQDRLLLYTDGLTEATRAPDDESFGEKELRQVLVSTPPSNDLTRAVVDAHRRWIGADAPLSDDITVIVIERTAPVDMAR